MFPLELSEPPSPLFPLLKPSLTDKQKLDSPFPLSNFIAQVPQKYYMTIIPLTHPWPPQIEPSLEMQILTTFKNLRSQFPSTLYLLIFGPAQYPATINCTSLLPVPGTCETLLLPLFQGKSISFTNPLKTKLTPLPLQKRSEAY